MAGFKQQLLTPGPLLDDQGVLCQAGYAVSLVKEYDRAAIRGGALRIKEWDYYCITGGDIVLALTIADNAYMSMDSVSLIDLSTGFQHTWSAMGLLPMGRRKLPSTSVKGDIAVRQKGYELIFENDGQTRVLTVRVDKFLNGKPLAARVVLTDAPKDSMVIATPFPGKKTAFYYNQKINCLRAEGKVAFDGREYLFQPDTATAVLDWGRGVWTYQNTWYWGSASGYADGVPFGMNLGYGFGDTSKATENMLFYNGCAHKLTHVDFGIPQSADGRDVFLKPWHITSSDNRLDLIFSPILDRASCTDVGVIKSDQHQVFGRFDGKAVLDDGTELSIRRLTGFAEKVANKW